MGRLREVLKHPDEFHVLLKLKLAVRHAEKQIIPPLDHPHWGFCYTLLNKFTNGGTTLLLQPFEPQLRNVLCIFYLILRALDTVEDDTSIPTEVKVPVLIDFHRHVYDPDWHFSCGTEDCKTLMDQFHHVSTAFAEIGKVYQEIIEDITKRMGEWMAKFICKEVETMDDYDEYCHYVTGPIGIGMFKIFEASGKQDFAPENLSSIMGVFLQKTNIIRDYLEDISEIPKPRMFWPREVCSKYVNRLEDLKYEENSVKAAQCLNEMITDALKHVEDCLKHMSALKDNGVFRFCAIRPVLAMGTLALCYNNIDVFKTGVKLRPGLAAKIYERTRTMTDVYNVFFEFASVMKSKVEMHDPHSMKTLSRLNEIQDICRKSGVLSNRKFYIIRNEQGYRSAVVNLHANFVCIMFVTVYT
ncbi:hypothetical protein Ddye_020002 [Dipteronia dyeriana]|uniref:squalene synthase n=1 Tax=Dipteronia dyeriana TaxID=168575 RepID=A0AAD9WWA0_9ROSI|nr:hypothetical protein Ddye_020002 [Dipteronia dyeriana]